MLKREIGHSGIFVNAIGLGCMGLSEFYGPAVETRDGVALLHAAIDAGVNHFDTAQLYGMGANERLLGEAFHDRRDKVVIATKFGPVRDRQTGAFLDVDGSEANMRAAIEESLQFLKTDHVDLYYLHRVDLKTPIEETVGAMAKLVDEGKVRALGLSEASADTLRRANKVHPIAALQSEYSIFSRDIEDGSLKAVDEIGASLVAYSPLGRGLLTGSYTPDHTPQKGDFRSAATQPRFETEAFKANLELVDEVKAVAAAHNAKPAQIALAWVLGRGDNVLTIPGTTKLANLESNLAGADIGLTTSERDRLNALADRVKGARYPESRSSNINA
ncbi:aldo/keto reductase [Maricaulis sp. W15]|uniref:aldo/keto reductase n=1 Tax=Maricaulis sp. W15 TaxID=1772333 RepID=UPI000948C9AB|nr:aldo/keto reductase [Maricaulis sp. W15]OLF80785.1 aldo/keto reductase [Maricaulis sp. W15]